MRLNLTEEEMKRVNPEAIKSMIKNTEAMLKNGYRNDHEELRDQLNELNEILAKISA